MQFLENQGILFNVTVQNNIEVWDIERKQLCDVFMLKEDITSFTVVQQTSYAYIGDSGGNISVLKLDLAKYHLVQMNYRIPLSASHVKLQTICNSSRIEKRRRILVWNFPDSYCSSGVASCHGCSTDGVLIQFLSGII